MSGATRRHSQALLPSRMIAELLNRSAVIVKPLQPYLDWCKTDDEEGLAESVFKSLRNEPHVFLIPEYDDSSSRQAVLKRSWPFLFEAMLEGWVTDEEYWPESRTLDMFLEWFEIQMVAAVQDLASDTPVEPI